MRIFHEFKNNLKNLHLVEKDDTIIVGVSGGSDSTALLFLLDEVAKPLSLKVIVAHVNYHTRGSDSNADEKLVKKFANKLGLTFEVKNTKAPKKGNFENWARETRYTFFKTLQEEFKAKVIAVAHTKDDQAETILMHFIKGAGLEGLAAMRPKDGTIIRPLLTFTKQELRDYLQTKKVLFQEDASNKNNKLTRNRVRNVLIPQLQKYNPNLVDTLTRNASIFAEVNDYLQLEAFVYFERMAKVQKDTVTFQAPSFQELARPLAREVLHLTFKKLGHTEPLSGNHFDQVYKVAASNVSRKKKEISRHLKVTRLHDVILIERYR